MADHAAGGGIGRFLTPADAAEILNVPLSTVLALVDSGELAAIRVGTAGRVRIERTMLDAYVDAMYEESRRRNLWQQAEFAGIPEIADGRLMGSPDDE